MTPTSFYFFAICIIKSKKVFAGILIFCDFFLDQNENIFTPNIPFKKYKTKGLESLPQT